MRLMEANTSVWRNGCVQASRLPLSHSEASISSRKSRVEICGLLKELLREQVIVASEFAQMPQTALIGGPGVQGSRRLAQGAVLLGIGNGRGNRDRHRLGDLVLQCEDVSEIAIVALGPDMRPGLGLDQLRGKPDPVAGFAQDAFQHLAHADVEAALL